MGVKDNPTYNCVLAISKGYANVDATSAALTPDTNYTNPCFMTRMILLSFEEMVAMLCRKTKVPDIHHR
eukprot:248146-Ditylum_brightwellii.AAC.2